MIGRHTLGARASIELALLEARLDLKSLERQKSNLLKDAEAWDRSGTLPCQSDISADVRSASCRLKAFLLGPDIAKAALKVVNLESQLKGAPAQVAPCVTAEQCAAMDDTMVGVAA